MAVQLETDDKCAGVETPGGQKFDPVDGIITMPDHLASYADQVAQLSPGMMRRYKKSYAGFGEGKLRKPWRTSDSIQAGA